MVDKKNNLPNPTNVKGLMQDLVEKLDSKMQMKRKGTLWEDVRPSDAKLFLLTARHQRSIADLAKALGISRQAAHKSVKRLLDRDVVELRQFPGNNRDKIVVITDAGNTARIMVAKSLGAIESEIEERIGKKRLEEFRQTLLDLNDEP
ncbi:MAG: winged helix-turn-helix transcriptional regulator [Oleispira sp.]|nr:winged helix-turn-helix transcriptional regulator [Oleispira sp.]